MYDKALEQLIDAVIADGIITDQERKVVSKKAASLGIDQEEIEVYLEGRLDAFMNSGSSNSGKHGDVRVCPNCGANVPSFATKCAECGFEFRGSGAVKSMKELFIKLDGTTDVNKKCEIIQNFPIPNNKEDLLEFVSASASNSKDAVGILATRENHWITGLLGALSIIVLLFLIVKGEGETFSVSLGLAVMGGFTPGIICLLLIGLTGKPSKIAKGWEIKLNNALNKVNIVAQNDPDIKFQANNITASYRKKKMTTRVFFIGWVCVLVLIFIVAICMPSTRLQEREEREKVEELNRQQKELRQDSIEHAIHIGEYELADRLIKSESIGEGDYFEFLQKCVEDMGEKGNFREAKAFIKRKTVFFKTEHDSSWGKEYNRDVVIENLNTIIESYR